MTGKRIRNNRKKGVFLKGGFFICLCFCLFATVWLRSAVVNLEYQLGEIDRLRADMIRERKVVVAKRANIYSTEKIESVAVRRLGMILPERENVFFVKKTAAAGPIRASMAE